jgi:hypothetical protein
LSGVVVDNFRAFGHAEMSLPEAGLVLLTGANNTGKTALLSAFGVIAGDTGDTTSLQHASGDGPAQVTARFSLSQAERASLLANTSRREEWLAGGAIPSLDFLFAENEALRMQGQAGLGLTQIRADWPAHGMQTLAALNALPAQDSTMSMLSALTSDTDPPGMSGSGSFESGLWLDQMLRARRETEPLATLLAAWRTRFYHFRALRPGTQRSQSLTSANRLEPTGDNLSAVLLYLATDRPGLSASCVP